MSWSHGLSRCLILLLLGTKLQLEGPSSFSHWNNLFHHCHAALRTVIKMCPVSALVTFNSPASYVPGIYCTFFFSMNLHSVGNGYVATKNIHFPGSLDVWRIRGRELGRLGVWGEVARSHLVGFLGIILMRAWVPWGHPSVFSLVPCLALWVMGTKLEVVLESSQRLVKMPFAAC